MRTPVDTRPKFETAVRDAIEESLRATHGKMRKLGIRREDFCSS